MAWYSVKTQKQLYLPLPSLTLDKVRGTALTSVRCTWYLIYVICGFGLILQRSHNTTLRQQSTSCCFIS